MWPDVFKVWLHQTPNFSSYQKWCGKKFPINPSTTGFSGFCFFRPTSGDQFSWDFFGGTPTQRIESSKSLPIFPSITWARWKITSFPIKKCFLAPKTNPWWNSYECCIPKNVHTMYILSWYGSSHRSHVGELHSSRRNNGNYWGWEHFSSSCTSHSPLVFSTEMLRFPIFLYGKKSKICSPKFRKSLTTPPSADPRSETPSLQKRSRRHEISHMRLFPRYCESPNLSCPFLVSKTPRGVAVLQENLLSFFLFCLFAYCLLWCFLFFFMLLCS